MPGSNKSSGLVLGKYGKPKSGFAVYGSMGTSKVGKKKMSNKKGRGRSKMRY